MNNLEMTDALERTLAEEFQSDIKKATSRQLHTAIGKVFMGEIKQRWDKSREEHSEGRMAFYLSAEYLVGRVIYNNLFNLGITETVRKTLEDSGIDINCFEDIEDAALGSGGLGRLAACIMDSAAAHGIPLYGYGIRYRYGLFRQRFENGFQVEEADDWQRQGDPWSVRREEDAVHVCLSGFKVRAVPYDMAITGYGTDNINTLRLWQSEPVHEFDFRQFDRQQYSEAWLERNKAENISSVIYPNDSEPQGKKLRFRQQYFLSSASLQDIVRQYKKRHGNSVAGISAWVSIQLNDTHPVVSVPEFIRLLMDEEGLSFEDAFIAARDVFSYTNHTVLSEALEKWDVSLIENMAPRIMQIITMIDNRLLNELESKGVCAAKQDMLRIISGDKVHMARLAVYASSHTNGVSEIHTELIKSSVLKEWHDIYPERFVNITNGVTQRRWLGLCNPELSGLITENIGRNWLKEGTELKKLDAFERDADVIEEFNHIKHIKKIQLADYIRQREGETIDPSFIFDIQCKRMHEYKRQLLNAFSVLDIYFGLKDGRIREFHPTAFIFAGKAASGYKRAKGVIKFTNEIAGLVNGDKSVRDSMRVVFASNYNVSYAEKLFPAADISEQISLAGTEASGTGNMKFMLNGTVTLGTYDGANVEIVQQAGMENNYIFGARVEDIARMRNDYRPEELYANNPRLRRVVDTLIDGTFNDAGSGFFKEIYDSLLYGASWHRSDNYFLFYDFEAYMSAKLKAISDYTERIEYGRKCWHNMCNAGGFSSDYTTAAYAKEIWHIDKGCGN